MLQFDPPSTLTLAQVLYVVLAGFLAGGGIVAWVTVWQRRKHGPAEVRKLDAEARSIVLRDDLAVGATLAGLIKDVAQATAELREMRKERIEWERRAEKILEQLSECQDELKAQREANKQLQIRYDKKDHELKVAMRILAEHKISYSEGDGLRNLVENPIKP